MLSDGCPILVPGPGAYTWQNMEQERRVVLMGVYSHPFAGSVTGTWVGEEDGEGYGAVARL